MPAPTRPSASSPLAFHPHRIVISSGVLLALGSMSLPYVHAADQARPAITLDALPTLLLLLPVFAATLLPDRSRPMWPGAIAGSAVLVLLALPQALIRLLDSFVLANSLGGTVGAGPLVLCAGTVVAAVGVGLGLFRPVGPGRPAESAPTWPAGEGTPRRSPSRLDESPFGEPLFDSLEVATPVTSAGPSSTASAPSPPAPTEDEEAPPTLVIEGERAAARIVDDRDGLESP